MLNKIKLFGLVSVSALTVFLNAGYANASSQGERIASDGEIVIRASPTHYSKAASLSLREAMSEAKSILSAQPEADVTIELGSGVYRINETIVLDTAFNGLQIVAARGARPIISSGIPLLDWRRATDLPYGIPERVRDQVWEQAIPAGAPIPNMLYDVAGILPMAASPIFKPAIDNTDARKSDRVLYAPAGFIHDWKNPQDILISIIPVQMWSHNVLRVEEIDPKENWLQTSVECTYEMVRDERVSNDRSAVKIMNAPEFLDEPGEWIVDSKRRMIYYIPREGESPGDSIVVPTLHTLIRIEGSMDAPTEGITFDGIDFQHTLFREWEASDMGVQHDWEAIDVSNGVIQLRNAKNCVIRNSRITMAGSTGVRFDQLSQGNILENSEVSIIGSNGVFLGGLYFDVRDVNHGNIIRNNHIHETGLIRFDGSGIFVAQSGSNQIRHNLVHDTGYSGIVLSGIINVVFSNTWLNRRELGQRLLSDDFLEQSGLDRNTRDYWSQILPYLYTRDNIVEYNLLYDNVLRGGDGNPIYLRGAGPDNVIRRNYVMSATRSHAGIRMDDGQWGTTVEQNVVYFATYAGIQIKGANRIINNVVVDVLSQNDPRNEIDVANFGSMHYRVDLASNQKRLGPVGDSEIRDNIFVNTREAVSNLLQFHDRGRIRPNDPAINAQMIVDDLAPNGILTNNLYWDAYDPERAAAYLTPGNRVDDPLLRDPQGGDFTFPPDSPAAQMGIKPVDVSQAGLDLSKFPERLSDR